MYRIFALAFILLTAVACPATTEPKEPTEPDATCLLDAADQPEFATELGCTADFQLLASAPMSASIPGARSVKTVIDRLDDNAVYFQDTNKYKIHWEFAHAHLSGQGLPPVPPLSQFNSTEYYRPSRRFLLGAGSYYEGPKRWVYEISPYDTATADLIQTAYELIKENAFFGEELAFHPTSLAVEKEAQKLPETVKLVTTDELFAGIDYQPLNLATGVGRLVFQKAKDLEDAPPDFRDLVVLDAVPNDIGVVAGIITAEFQTPLSHINVLSQNRGTPNMGLVGALENEELRALEGKWVELTVGPFEYTIREISEDEADSWWEANKPPGLSLPPMDLSVTGLHDIHTLLDLENLSLGDALKAAIPAFGGKASHYGAFPYMTPDMGASDGTPCGDGGECAEGYVCKNRPEGTVCKVAVPAPKAFAIPLYYYHQHMTTHGLDKMAAEMMADSGFINDPVVRKNKLEELQDAIKAAPFDAELEALITDKIVSDFNSIRMRFRSSTNAEDLDGFTGAGLYTSKSADLNDPDKPIADAVRKVWASIWNYKAYQEREYRSIPHDEVAMALLVHRSFPDEEANGVALTGNIFDTSGLEPGFYINVQAGETSVVLPDPGVTTDSFIYYYYQPGQPVVFLSHSNLINEGETVLTNKQTYRLGQGLDRIHKYFQALYGPNEKAPTKFYGMDVEFKFDGEPGEEPELFIKQARPHPGWGL